MTHAPPTTRWPLLAALLLASAAAGCVAPEKKQEPGYQPFFGSGPKQTSSGESQKAEIDPTRVEEKDDIVQIITFWQPLPWLTNESNDRIIGFRVPAYFVSGQTEKGAFVPGRIIAWLYKASYAADGERQRELVYSWELPRDQSMLYRVRKLSLQGYFYGFRLTWPAEIDLRGQEVEIDIGYERMNGSVVTSGGRRFKLPAPEKQNAARSAASSRPVGRARGTP